VYEGMCVCASGNLVLCVSVNVRVKLRPKFCV